MSSDSTFVEDRSSSSPTSSSGSPSDSLSDSRTSSSSRTSFGSPRSPRIPSPPSIRDVLNPARLETRSRKVNALKSPLDPNRVVEISDSSPVGNIAEDVASSYYIGDLGDDEGDEKDLYDLTAGLGLDEAGPSWVDVGKGKSYKRYL